jgi:hypothetical protein
MKSIAEIQKEILSIDTAKMLLADGFITQRHNGISYNLIREDLVHEIAIEYSTQQLKSLLEEILTYEIDFKNTDKNYVHSSDIRKEFEKLNK